MRTRREIAEAMGKRAGLPIELPKDAAGWGRDRIGWPARGESAWSALLSISWTCSVLLEADRIRIVTHPEAERFWKEWWERQEKK